MRNVLRTLASDQHASGRHQAASVLAQSSLYRVGMSEHAEREEGVVGMDALQQTVEQMRALGRDRGIKGITSKHIAEHFQLGLCGGCGLPSWEQPCPVCGFYPYGNDPREVERCQRPGYTKGHWIRTVESYGGIAAWYFSGCKQTRAWDFSEYRELIETLTAEAAQLEWPDPEAVYEEVVVR